LERLGKSQSPETFTAALSTTADQIVRQYRQNTKVQTGREVPIEQLMTPETREILSVGGLVPKGLKPEDAGKRLSVKRTEPTLEAQEEQERQQLRIAQEFEGERRTAFRRQQQLQEEEASRAEERHGIALRGEQRAAAREQRQIREEQAARIQAAFVEMGRALRSGGGSVGVSQPQVPGQQVGAFQVAPIQRRQAPTIPRKY
jgi:hypothetical protein